MGLRGFNLLKTQPTPPTVWEKFYSWVLGTARTIIIVVQIIVIASFVTRVVVDTQAKRLEKEIDQKEKVISGFTVSENRYRVTQDRTDHYRELWKEASNYYTVLEELDAMAGSYFSDLVISIEDGVVTLSGQGDGEDITRLETALKSLESLYNVEAVEIQTDEGLSTMSIKNFGYRALIKTPNGRESISGQLNTNTISNLDPQKTGTSNQ